jgi:hypothetical protein
MGLITSASFMYINNSLFYEEDSLFAGNLVNENSWTKINFLSHTADLMSWLFKYSQRNINIQRLFQR